MTRPACLAVLAAALGLVAMSPAPAAGGAVERAWQVGAKTFDRAAFPASPVIDNKLLPWPPGTKLVYDGKVVTAGEVRLHRLVIIVTDLVKMVDGVPALIIRERDMSNGFLAETELAFQAQDDNGVVWSLGEYPEEYAEGTFEGAPNAWLSGAVKARAGIVMQANPKVGGFDYSQGRAPAIDFADRAKVKGKNREVCVPAGCFTDVWVTDEWDALDPAGGHQIKYHAPGVGVVFVRAQGGDARETLSLISVSQLDAAAMDHVRAQTLRLDRRAYIHAPDVYAGTQPPYLLP